MPFPIKTCVVCSEEFELTPQKPGFANRCPECSSAKPTDPSVVRQNRRRQILESMSDEERAAVQKAEEAGRTVLLFELNEPQKKALAFLGLTHKRHEIATKALAAGIRNQVRLAADRALKAKLLAESEGRKVAAAKCEAEIKKWAKLKRALLEEARVERLDRL
jgi:hypothetical protein